jgi:hypothetical protein
MGQDEPAAAIAHLFGIGDPAADQFGDAQAGVIGEAERMTKCKGMSDTSYDSHGADDRQVAGQVIKLFFELDQRSSSRTFFINCG